MSQLKHKHFQLSLIAAAVLSLSACSTNPKVAGVDLGQVGSGIGKVGSAVGRKSAEIGAVAWEGTKNILHIGETETEDSFNDIDLALMDDDIVGDVQVAALGDEPLLPIEAQDTSKFIGPDDQFASIDDYEIDLSDDTLNDAAGKTFGTLPEGTDDALLNDGSLAEFDEYAESPSDHIHEVVENDTLWVIAKATTGDANNWHIIADINDLAPNPSVYVGQKLRIPNDMLKAEFKQPEAAPAEDSQIVIAAETDKEPEIVIAAAPTSEQLNDNAAVSLNAQTVSTDVAPAAANPANIIDDATAIKVAEGETLWDFAKRTTGDALNWENLASKNNLNDSQIASIRPGQKIYVPNDMVRERDANGTLIAQGGESTLPTTDASAQNEEALAASAAVLAGTNTPEQGDIKIVEAAYQDDSIAKPVTAETLSQEANLEAETNLAVGKVMVRGTYYPKAVYSEADFTSALLMRVSPGTELTVSKADGLWLEVETSEGIGYVHSRDIK